MEPHMLKSHLIRGQSEGFFNRKADIGNVYKEEDDKGNVVFGYETVTFTVAVNQKILIKSTIPILLESGDKITLSLTTTKKLGVGVNIFKCRIPRGVQGRDLWTSYRNIHEIYPM